MRTILGLEQLGLFLLSILLFAQVGSAWWAYLTFFLAPDLAMLGYLAGPRVGAAVYNLAHPRGLAAAFLADGVMSNTSLLTVAGIILPGHSSLDRVFGYGLKYPDSFHHTHLGWIGRGKAVQGQSAARKAVPRSKDGGGPFQAGEASNQPAGRVILE